jgi:glycosyltransferase involved in cell wall biosynthesis
MKPMGGSELMYYTVDKLLRPGYQQKVNLILSFCDPQYIDSTKKNVVWQQLNVNEEVTNAMADPKFVEKIDTFVWVSHWQYQRFLDKYKVPAFKSVIIKNATQPCQWIPRNPKDKIRLVYTSTPWRGLDILVNAFKMLNRTDVELDVFSSTQIYGPAFEQQTKGQFDWLWDECRNTPGINYHGYQPNDVVRATVRDAHIFAYPNTFEETSCISAIEALIAGCKVVTTDHGALPETCSEWADYVPWGPNREILATRYAYALNNAINNYWTQNTQDLLKRQNEFYNGFYSWNTRMPEWQGLVDRLSKE